MQSVNYEVRIEYTKTALKKITVHFLKFALDLRISQGGLVQGLVSKAAPKQLTEPELFP